MMTQTQCCSHPSTIFILLSQREHVEDLVDSPLSLLICNGMNISLSKMYHVFMSLLFFIISCLSCISIVIITFVPQSRLVQSCIPIVSYSALMFPCDISVFMFGSEQTCTPNASGVSGLRKSSFLSLLLQFPIKLLICMLITTNAVCRIM